MLSGIIAYSCFLSRASYALPMSFQFTIVELLRRHHGRAGKLETAHGVIETPAFVTVGTKATVKAMTPEQVKAVGAQVVLANTYHLYLQPGEDIVAQGGGLGKFMHWEGPTMTDSGGFQVFSLGAAYGHREGKIMHAEELLKSESEQMAMYDETVASQHGRLAIIDEEGVSFTSHLDGSFHRFTPERSIEIQHKLGADIIFAFDECTSPTAPHMYQKQALGRTQRWAKRSLDAHRTNLAARRNQGIFGVVQGGRYEDLRRESARDLAGMGFDGYGIGGSFSKEDIHTAVGWVCAELPPEKPRHLLGIGEPLDLFDGIENGADLFDCVAPTRNARTGTVYTKQGKIHLRSERYKNDVTALDSGCACPTCTHYTRAYVAHLFRAKEMLAATLATQHNLYFLIHLVQDIRASILAGRFQKCKEEFFSEYRA